MITLDKKQIIAQIKNGNLQIRTDGFKGNACLSEMQKILKELANLGVDAKPDNIKMKDNQVFDQTLLKE